MCNLERGDRIWFWEDKKPFRVRASNERFAICTKPFNLRPKTVLYTIVDFERGVRGMSNYVFDLHDYYMDEDCEDALKELERGEMEVSWRTHKHISIRIKRIAKVRKYETIYNPRADRQAD